MENAIPSIYQQQIHKRHYARWSDDLGRRETWEETVDRYVQQQARQVEKLGGKLTQQEEDEVRDGILNLRVMPSMRQIMTAGPAIERDNVAGYNCAFTAIDHVRAFDEILYILCCGTGVGFSVESKNIQKLPEVPEFLSTTETTIVVEDSKIGWAKALRQLIALLYSGEAPRWDVSKVRPAGERIKTFGGRASGPQPIEDIFKFFIHTFKNATGRKLKSTEVHSLVCKIGDIVVVGGVRRSALICLYDPWDSEMAHIKSGEYWHHAPHLRLANNSAVWINKPTAEVFIDQQWSPLVKGKSGEPGIVNRSALQNQSKKTERRDPNHDFGVNPCGEISLRNGQFCNLSEVVARPEDNFEDIIEKVRIATIIGTIQSTYTDFRYLRPKWKKNCEEERIIGVSITGIVDNPILNGARGKSELRSTLHAIKHVAIDTNKEWAERIGVNQSVSITCVKPSGTVSQLVLSGSGINEWHSEYFIRRVRGNKVDPASQLIYTQGVHCEDDMMDPDNAWVFSWPIKAPKNALTRKDITAIEKLELWLDYANYWCEHNPSTTINVKEPEWIDVGAFVFKHFDEIAGVAFIPYSDHVYQQAPYEEITKEEYEKLVKETPDSIDWSILQDIEKDDFSEGARELACAGPDGCDVSFIVKSEG